MMHEINKLVKKALNEKNDIINEMLMDTLRIKYGEIIYCSGKNTPEQEELYNRFQDYNIYNYLTKQTKINVAYEGKIYFSEVQGQRKKLNIERNIERILPFIEHYKLCNDIRYSIMQFL